MDIKFYNKDFYGLDIFCTSKACGAKKQLNNNRYYINNEKASLFECDSA